MCSKPMLEYYKCLCSKDAYRGGAHLDGGAPLNQVVVVIRLMDMSLMFWLECAVRLVPLGTRRYQGLASF